MKRDEESRKAVKKWMDKDVYIRIGRGTIVTNNGSIIILTRNIIFLVAISFLIKYLIN